MVSALSKWRAPRLNSFEATSVCFEHRFRRYVNTSCCKPFEKDRIAMSILKNSRVAALAVLSNENGASDFLGKTNE